MLFSAALLQMSVNAQHSIYGTIYDSNSGEILPGAHIVLEGTYLTTISNQDGKYSIKNLGNSSTIGNGSFQGPSSYHRLRRSSLIFIDALQKTGKISFA